MNNEVSIAQMVDDLGLTPRASDRRRKIKENLEGSLSVPSTTHTYSIITEFIKEWFTGRFPKDYFNYIHIGGKHVYEEYRNFDIRKLIKKDPPVIAIAPRINLAYDRDMLDTNRFGADYLVRTGRPDQAYIRDYERNCFIGSRMELLDLEYDIRIMVETKAQQIDLYKQISMLFPMGHVTEENIHIDYHLPMDIMKQYAVDSGFKLNEEGDVENPIEFIKYVNKNSRLPVIYKYRTITGNLEFFIRMDDIDIVIDMTEMPGSDDGDMVGMRHKRYNIDLRIGVKAPTPKFFAYYSSNKHTLIGLDATDPNDIDDIIVPINIFKMELIPKINSKGWNQYIFTDYLYDPKDLDVDKTRIDMNGIFGEGDIVEVIKLAHDTGVSPDTFVDFKIYNGKQYEIDYKMDWVTNTLILDPREELKAENTTIVVYMDTKYTHDTILRLHRSDRTQRYRIKKYTAEDKNRE